EDGRWRRVLERAENRVDPGAQGLETLVGRRAGLALRDLFQRAARLVEKAALPLRRGRQRSLLDEVERTLELRGREPLQLGIDRAGGAQRPVERGRQQALRAFQAGSGDVLAPARSAEVAGAGVAVVAVRIRLAGRRQRAGGGGRRRRRR